MTRIALVLLACSVAARAENLVEELVALELARTWDEGVFARALEGDPRERRAAARAAGRIKDERALAVLLGLIDDDVAPVRRSALFALGQLGKRAALIPLRDALATLPAADRAHALEALGKTGDPRAVSAVVRQLRAGEPETRGAAALALARLGDDSALPELFAALAAERDAEPRWRMVYAGYLLLRARARRAGGPVVVDTGWAGRLAESLSTKRAFHERVFAAYGLGSIAGSGPTLVPLLSDRDDRVVVAGLRALGKRNDAATLDAVDALSSGNGLVLEARVRFRVRAGGALEKKDPRRARLKDRLVEDMQVAQQRKDVALRLLAAQGVAGLDETFRVFRNEDEEIVWRVNSRHWTPAGVPTDLPRTHRGRLAAAELCGEDHIDATVASVYLVGLMEEVDDFAVRSTAIASLAKRDLKETAPRIVAVARKSPGTVDSDVRMEAANALAAMGVYDPWLDEAARDPDHPVRDAARAALKKLGRSLPPLPPPSGFALDGLDASAILAEARALIGARVSIETNRGEIVMILFPDEAPAHCVNFARLVKKGFYDNKTWHRVVADFVIQGGCPRGDGWGGPGYFLPDEIGTRPYVRGTVGMPKSGDDTGGCQIFITHLPTPHLDGRYSVYAQVVAGLSVVDQIRAGDKIVKARLHTAGQR
jgi:cyclophilin family peptidyl-prolyl cis-trans isomerase/HEAT repeat protein